jgi:hypothetical protein
MELTAVVITHLHERAALVCQRASENSQMHLSTRRLHKPAGHGVFERALAPHYTVVMNATADSAPWDAEPGDEESDLMTPPKSPIPVMEAATSRSTTPRDAWPSRIVVIIGLLTIALIHLLDLPDKIEETPYLGVAFIALIIGSLVLAGVLSVQDNRTALLAAGGLAAAVIVGYAISRTTGMPGAMDDVGNWLEPLGLASLFVEGTVVVFALPALREA